MYRRSFRNILAMAAVTLLMAACKPSDKEIAEAVKAKVTAVAPSIVADVKDGVVTLSGEVTDEATKAAAASALQGIKGMKNVVNNITVPPPPPPPVVTINPDDVLRSGIDSALKVKGLSGVTAAVNNGEVTLSGTVSKDDLRKAMQAANELKPKKVVNQLVVKK